MSNEAADSEVLRLRIDPNIKKEASVAAEAMGLSLSVVVTIFLNHFASEKNFLLTTKFPMQRHWQL